MSGDLRAERQTASRRALALLPLVVLAALASLALRAGGLAVAADPCAPPVTNEVACENTKPGDPPADWQVNGIGDQTIQGFATSMSVNLGQTIDFKVKTPASSYHIDILRLGYYGGDGARLIAANIQPSAKLPQTQPSCSTSSATGLVECGNWNVSASWTVPATAVSGLYIAHLVRNDTGGESQIFFVVRDDSSHSDVVLKTSDATWQAYNAYGGNSLYSCTVSCPSGEPEGYKAAYAVSYNRPFDGTLTTDNGMSDPFYSEYQLIRFLERNGYDLSYVSQHDVDANGALLRNHRAFISSGHDEYWSGGERQSVEAARDAGVSLAFFSGNELFWKTRWAASSDGSNTPYRTLVTYKETHFPAPVDPAGPGVSTGTWRDPRFSPPGDAGRPENGLTGQIFLVNAGTSDIKVPGAFAKMRFWRNTPVSTLSPSQTLTLSPGTGTLGYEWDVDPDNGFRPAGRIPLSSTTVSGLQTFTDYGTKVEDLTTATHSLSLYRAPSGALVFGSGTVQWSWGLDVTNAWNSGATNPNASAPDPTMQQATVNLLADMGAQPATLQPGLLATARSTDTTPPSATVGSPAAGAQLSDGDAVTVSGTAADGGGGVVAAVEVSSDGGATWHPASGTTSWTYPWIVHGSPATTLKARAVDDSGNIGAASAGTSVSVACPCSLFGKSVPPTIDSGDNGSLELGVKFRSDVAGTIGGIRFYKAAANTGTHVGSLWTAGGAPLAEATFSGESASGWQQVKFAAPVPIQANTTYVAGYFAPKGRYSAAEWALNHPPATGADNLDSPPLHVLPDTGNGNGLYQYSSDSTFPTSSYQAENYWVDVLFAPTGPLQPPGLVTGVGASAGLGQATVTWAAPASGGAPASYRITPYAGANAQAPVTAAGTATSATVPGLSGGTSYTFTVTALNAAGSGPESAPSNAVTPGTLGPPGAPTGVGATAKSAGAQVTWTAPASDGGGAIGGYRITPYAGASAQAATTVGAGATSASVSGLANGTTYTFTVAAINAAGPGPESGPSNSATPYGMIFDLATPSIVDSGDGLPVELGVKFRSDVAGTIGGIRFYKAAANTGTHVGSLWTAGGAPLAEATFSGESASGWQQVKFAAPVPIQANTTYVAGYFAPSGHYSVNGPTLASGVDNPPLHAPADSGTSANGVYAYGLATTFPASSYQASNYWVDVLFSPAPPPLAPGQVTGVTATAGLGSASLTWSAPASGGAPSSYVVTPFAGGAAQAPTTVTGSPPPTATTIGGLTPGTSYTFTVRAVNATGSGPDSAPSNAVTPAAAATPGAPTAVAAFARNQSALVGWVAPVSNGGSAISGYRVTPYLGTTAQAPTTVGGAAASATVGGLTNGASYTFTVTAINAVGAGPASAASGAAVPRATLFEQGVPATVDVSDSSSVVLGVKFTSDSAGKIRGIRFYKSAANSGSHVVSLWSASGTLLAQATASGESASGWQEVPFSSPVSIAANTTYVAGYLAPKGHYSATGQGFAAATNSPPLHAPATSTSANGVYAYASSSAFPAKTYNATNYWVDVLFTP